MLPMIQREIVEKQKVCTEEEVLDYYAIGQCTPGVIAVNVATFVGCKLKGFWGGAVATFAVILPSLFIITAIAACLSSFASFPVVQHALAGIRVAVAVLVFRTVLQLYKKNLRSFFAALVFFAVLVLSLLFKIASMYIVIGAIIMGILFGTLGRAKE